jgi:hypothetical protein
LVLFWYIADLFKVAFWSFDLAEIEMRSLMMARLKERLRYWGF